MARACTNSGEHAAPQPAVQTAAQAVLTAQCVADQRQHSQQQQASRSGDTAEGRQPSVLLAPGTSVAGTAWDAAAAADSDVFSHGAQQRAHASSAA